MLSLTAWIMTLALASTAPILIAAANAPDLNMAVCAIVALTLSALAIRENWHLIGAGTAKSAIASATARHCGIVWAWGALSIFLLYSLILENRWPEWWQFFIGFGAAALASIGFSNLLNRDAAAGKDDPALIKMGRILIIGQIIGVIAALISMFVDGKFPRAPTFADWAGCNIFFFGGAAILAVSLNALRSAR